MQPANLPTLTKFMHNITYCCKKPFACIRRVDWHKILGCPVFLARVHEFAADIRFPLSKARLSAVYLILRDVSHYFDFEKMHEPIEKLKKNKFTSIDTDFRLTHHVPVDIDARSPLGVRCNRFLMTLKTLSAVSLH